jgi:hypothetical protein
MCDSAARGGMGMQIPATDRLPGTELQASVRARELANQMLSLAAPARAKLPGPQSEGLDTRHALVLRSQ